MNHNTIEFFALEVIDSTACEVVVDIVLPHCVQLQVESLDHLEHIHHSLCLTPLNGHTRGGEQGVLEFQWIHPVVHLHKKGTLSLQRSGIKQRYPNTIL